MMDVNHDLMRAENESKPPKRYRERRIKPPKRYKRYLLSVTKRDLKGLLSACEAEWFYHDLHDEKREARAYLRLCALLERKLEYLRCMERAAK